MSSWQAAEDTEADSWLYITAQWIVQTCWLIRLSSRSSSSDKERKSAMNANISPITEVRDGYLFCLLMLMLSSVPGTSSTWWLLFTRPHLRTFAAKTVTEIPRASKNRRVEGSTGAAKWDVTSPENLALFKSREEEKSEKEAKKKEAEEGSWRKEERKGKRKRSQEEGKGRADSREKKRKRRKKERLLSWLSLAA